MLDDHLDTTFVVTDFKQWVYCPRVWYYQHCLPKVRPTTYSMEAGAEAGRAEEGREERRSLRVYGLQGREAEAQREFNVRLRSNKLGLRGEADMVITLAAGEVIPVDYKLSETAGPHFKLQLAAYALILEEMRGCVVTRGFLYLIPLRRAEEIKIDKRLRKQALQALSEMQAAAQKEAMPAPTSQIAKCVSCEFRRFCNDVM
jgi:CRISPR-associated exonuclease Cas4